MSAEELDAWVRRLEETPPGDLFNPWFQQDTDHDITPDAPTIRRHQLIHYLDQRRSSARYLFVAEALGYQGGHFTGIAMTSERILMGYQEEAYGIKPTHVLRDVEPRRTSRTRVNRKGMSEPTATIMWGTLIKLGVDPYKVVLWNALPWHPYDSTRGLLSNRTPTRREMDAGLALLREFLTLFPGTEVIAVGRKCEDNLNRLNVDHYPVRHPANGGAPKFRSQVKELFDTGPDKNHPHET